MRAAIYARYSTDLQSASSIEDQIRLCRERVVKENGSIVEIYSDYAISGSSVRIDRACERFLKRRRAVSSIV